MRRNFDFYVFLRMCSVTVTLLWKLATDADYLKTVTLHIRKNTQKSKFLLSQAFKWKKIMLFVIPERPSKTFDMV